MASVEDEAFETLMREIKASAERIPQAALRETSRASALRDLSAAFRHLRGGQQPGGVHIDAK